MNDQIKKFTEMLDNDVEIKEDIFNMNLEEISIFIEKLGFNFSLEEFINEIKKIDEKELLKSELEDEELDQISAGCNFNYSIINFFKKIK